VSHQCSTSLGEVTQLYTRHLHIIAKQTALRKKWSAGVAPLDIHPAHHPPKRQRKEPSISHRQITSIIKDFI